MLLSVTSLISVYIILNLSDMSGTNKFGVEEVLIDETRPPYVLLSLTSLISVYIILSCGFITPQEEKSKTKLVKNSHQIKL